MSNRKPPRTSKTLDTRGKILNIARKLITRRGISAVTFAAIAERLGVSKQAVIYWFPTKEDLIRELAVEHYDDEAQAMEAAMAELSNPHDAIPQFLKASFEHHRKSWETFRLMYLFPQLHPETSKMMPLEYRREHLYPVTDRMYASLERHLKPELGEEGSARTLAVAVHCAALGLACMAGLMDACDDEMKESFDAYRDSLAKTLAQGVAASPERDPDGVDQ